MADYYPVLKKTVAALPENTGAARREIYQRARKAIVAQLKAYDPPLSPSEITSEQLRLEESIRKVEAEAARETLGFSSSQQPVTPPRPQTRPAEAGERKTSPATAAEPKAEPKPAAPAAPVSTPPASRAAPPPETRQTAPTPENRDLLKTAIDDARKLGEAADQATRSARGALDGESSGQPQKREPTLGRDERSDETLTAHGGRDHGRPLPPINGSMRASRLPAILGGVALLMLIIGVGAVGYSQRDTLMGLFEGSEEPQVARPAAPASTPTQEDTSMSRKNSARLLDGGETGVAPDARSVTTTRITPAEPQTDTATPSAPAGTPPPVRSVEPEPSAPATPPAGEAEGTEEPEETPTDTATDETPADPEPSQQDQIASATPPAGTAGADRAGASDAPVAQRAILYEEGAQAGSAGQASTGRAVWSVSQETIDGRAETVLKMRIEVPDRNIAANLTLRPNRDDTLPASHLLEVQFDLPPNFSGSSVAEVPGLVMKTTEEARGDALIGASVKVADGYFWVALSNIPDEQERNLTLLRDRGWIDIPMLYENGKRAILTLEKGTPGARAVEQATTAWRAG